MSHSARYVYWHIRRFLAATCRPSRVRIDAAIQATHGKYAAGASLTQALLDERAADRRREDEKIPRLRAS